ncbi:MAG: hypothetical protein ACYDAE_26455, partial [Steroidobacteraceae bacterium]
RLRRHRLEVNRDLGADYVEAGRVTNTSLRPGLRRQNVRGGEIWVAGIVGGYCHAPALVPEELLRLWINSLPLDSSLKPNASHSFFEFVCGTYIWILA